MTPAPHPHPQISAHAWREQELLLMREVMRLVGRSPAPRLALGKMLHLMSELLGLNRGRIVLMDPAGDDVGAPRTASISQAYGLTAAEMARGRGHHRARAGQRATGHRAGH
jgi:Nif-specific regulatory protein